MYKETHANHNRSVRRDAIGETISPGYNARRAMKMTQHAEDQNMNIITKRKNENPRNEK